MRARRRSKAEDVFARVGVGDAVCDRAGGAGARGVGQSFVERLSFRCAFEAAVFVEEAGVDVQDALADDVEAEVAGLDDPSVDRPDGDLVRVTAADRHRPVRELEVVLDERSQRLVPGEVDAVEVVRLPLVPVGGRDEVDDRGHAPAAAHDRSRTVSRPSGRRAACARVPPSEVAWRPAKRQPSASAAAICSR